MEDRWTKELSYQRAYGLTPLEAKVSVERESGLGLYEIAELEGIAYHTVNTVLHRSRVKMKTTRSKGKMSVTVIKGNRDVEGTMYKQRAVEVLFIFLANVTDMKFERGASQYRLSNIPSEPLGDVQWFRDVLLRKAYLVGTTNDAESEMRADKFTRFYNELKPEDHEVLGIAVIRYVLEMYYMQYEIWND